MTMDNPPAGKAWNPALPPATINHLRERDVVSPRRFYEPFILYGSAAVLLLVAGFMAALWFYRPHDIPRQKAWEVAVAVYKVCDGWFADPQNKRYPLRHLLKSEPILLNHMAGCDAILNETLNEVYQARRIEGNVNAKANRPRR